ncbi:MAG: hypothetical protein IPF96_21425 [Rhodobacter sp.]|nr:hypothetical protein [Rhodobacter sp.]
MSGTWVKGASSASSGTGGFGAVSAVSAVSAQGPRAPARPSRRRPDFRRGPGFGFRLGFGLGLRLGFGLDLCLRRDRLCRVGLFRGVYLFLGLDLCLGSICSLGLDLRSGRGVSLGFRGRLGRLRLWHFAVQDADRRLVALYRFAFAQKRGRPFGLAEPRLSVEIAVIGNRGETDRVQLVHAGEGGRLVQRLFRQHGHAHCLALAGPVEHQIADRIGRASFKGLANLGPTLVVRGAGGIQLHIADLRIRDHQLGGKTARLQAQRGLAHVIKRIVQIGRGKGGVADRNPPPAGAMQELDAVVGEVQGKTWFHSAGLAQENGARKRTRRG